MVNMPFLKWQCTSCGEIFDEALGMPDYGIAPGTRFTELANDWLCPACGSPKSAYVVLDI